ncbi:MAG: RNA polymerase sigma factor RpoH [Rhodospirillales bacterium]|nr:RNA polymerase sigma factor RpoH [Rhodospirillales bacterium]
MSTNTVPTLPSEGSLSQYFREVWAFPMLDADTEQSLALKFRDQGDVEAAHQLVTSYLRLVCKIAMGYRGYGLPVADLISEGNIGLMKAVKKFDPDRGFRLSTYAMWWIKASITEYVLKSWSMVKLGTVAAQKKLFFSLRRVKNNLKIIDTGELTPEQSLQLSSALNVSEVDLITMNRRLSGRDVSLNAPMSQEGDSMEFQDTLVDDTPSPEHLTAETEQRDLHRDQLSQAMATLPDRERHIFEQRRLSEEPPTLEELGVHYGVSRERIRQLEVRAFEKVKFAMLEATQAIEAKTTAITA